MKFTSQIPIILIGFHNTVPNFKLMILYFQIVIFTMFYSTDLLTLRGGKFNLIWLLSTTKDKNALYRKRKKDLINLDVGATSQELIRMFPVQGKKSSLSLRTSSLLMHGVFISFRMKAELLRSEVLKLLTPSKLISYVNFHYFLLL